MPNEFYMVLCTVNLKLNIMKSKLIYVTKKQVSDFINTETERLKMNKDELLKEVKYVLFDLKQHPNDNRNQIKYYTRIYEALNGA